jgi:hypothetical protein
MDRHDKSHLSIRMDGELHDKFQYVAQYEGRSMSQQILFLLNRCVRDFEREHGAIELPEDRR